MSNKPLLTENGSTSDSDANADRLGAVTTTNPLAGQVRQFYDDATTRKAMEVLPHIGRDAGKAVDFLQVPGTVLKHLCAELSNSVLESALERDLSTPDFRQRILTANQLVNWRLGRHGEAILPSTISVSRRRPRVHLVAIPNGVGAEAFIHSLRMAFGADMVPLDVFVKAGKAVRYHHVQSIHVRTPLRKGPCVLGRAIAAAVDERFKSSYAERGRGTLFRNDEDATTSTQALMLAINLGFLIVGPIFKSDGASPTSEYSWTMLANIAADTGIPMVVVLTPGALAGLLQNCPEQPVLSSRHLFMVEPFESTSGEWTNVALTVWLKYLAGSRSRPPTWFVSTLWRLTLGRTELAVKLAAFIAGAWAADGRQELTEATLARYATQGLLSEQYFLKAIIRAEQGGKFTSSAVMRFSDWLDFPTVLRSLPSLDQSSYGDFEKVYTEKVRYIDSVPAPYGMSMRSVPPQYAMPKARVVQEVGA
jgi:hypothetical protein